MKKLLYIVCIISLAGFVIPACEVENCPPNTMTYLHLTLSDQYGRTFKTSDTITVFGQTYADVTVYDTLPDKTLQPRIVYDSLVSDTFINKEYGANGFSIPLSYADQTRIVLSYRSLDQRFQGTDTLFISHRNKPYFTNLDCSTMMFYELTSTTVTRHRLDSIQIINPNIDNNEKENIKIYFTVANSDE